MKAQNLIADHIKNIDYNPREMYTTPFYSEVIEFMKENKEADSDKLIQLFTKQFGSRIELRERYTLFKSVKSIKKWVTFFGVVLIVEIVIGILFAGLYIS